MNNIEILVDDRRRCDLSHATPIKRFLALVLFASNVSTQIGLKSAILNPGRMRVDFSGRIESDRTGCSLRPNSRFIERDQLRGTVVHLDGSNDRLPGRHDPRNATAASQGGPFPRSGSRSTSWPSKPIRAMPTRTTFWDLSLLINGGEHQTAVDRIEQADWPQSQFGGVPQ